MRVVELLRRGTLAVLVGIPVGLVLLDALLRLLDARDDNPLVAFIADSSAALTPAVLTDIFHDQAHWQTVLLTLLAYAILAAVIIALYAGVGRVVDGIGRRISARRERRESEAPPHG